MPTVSGDFFLSSPCIVFSPHWTRRASRIESGSKKSLLATGDFPKNDYIIVVSLNAHSSVLKINVVRHFVCWRKPDVMCIRGSWLSGLMNNSVASIPGYYLYSPCSNRPNQSGYGEVGVCERESLTYSQHHPVNTRECESLWICVITKSGSATIDNI